MYRRHEVDVPDGGKILQAFTGFASVTARDEERFVRTGSSTLHAVNCDTDIRTHERVCAKSPPVPMIPTASGVPRQKLDTASPPPSRRISGADPPRNRSRLDAVSEGFVDSFAR